MTPPEVISPARYEATNPRPLLALLALLVVVIGSLALPWPAYADDPLATKELQVERQLGCPICTNLPLNVCDNQLCQEMRGVIHQRLEAGETPDQVVAYFVSRYGDAVLLEPPQRGFSLAVWYIPIVGLLIGAGIFYVFLRQSLIRRHRLLRRSVSLDPELERYREQVRRDLEQLEEAP